jgi:drug/metabolite transporter (DMT)-like permease
MGITLGLAGAFFWGLADFIARFATRRVGTYRTSFYVNFTGFVLLCAYFAGAGGWSALRSASAGGWQPWAWGILVGILNSACSYSFYRAIEGGVLSIVAPVSSSYPALTLILSLFSGESLRWHNGLGIAAVLIGVILASTSAPVAGEVVASDAEPHPSGPWTRGIGWAIAAACGFGVMFWLIGFRVMPVLGGVASVWIIRATTSSTLAAVSVPIGQTLALPRNRVWAILGCAGVLDTAAFLSNNFGLHAGPVAVVTVLASLYSAVTVVLARIFLKERLRPLQWCGLLLIFSGIVLVNL